MERRYRDDNDIGNHCIFEEVGVWRGSITPARRLNLAAVKGNHLITQLCSKMDVSGKKEQRKETELDECWLKFTTKVTPKTGLDFKEESGTLLLFEVLREFGMERINMRLLEEMERMDCQKK